LARTAGACKRAVRLTLRAVSPFISGAFFRPAREILRHRGEPHSRFHPFEDFPMPFANIKVPQAALSTAQKAEIIHRITDMFVEYLGEAARPHTMVLIEDVPDGGYGRADEVFVIPDAYRATD
jgi:4-oxalocrotonate tautomerase